MKRLQQQRGGLPRPADAPIGGIPVDSEYIIFVIDTSGSMQLVAGRDGARWRRSLTSTRR